jgi:hypothetical protein
VTDLVVIGLCGKARSGKDTAAAALSLHRGCHRIALADGIREALASLSGPSGDFYKELTPEHNFRRALQTLGTEGRDAANCPGLWVDLALAKIWYAWRLHPVQRSRFVIPDIRYRHEAAMFRSQVARWGGRFGILGLIRRDADIPESSHSSETEVSNVITNRDFYNESTVGKLILASVQFFDGLVSGRYVGLQ